MDKFDEYFENQEYQLIIDKILGVQNYENNLRNLQYLVASYYYLRKFEETINIIDLIQKFDKKMALTMFIDSYICLGNDANKAIDFVDKYLKETIQSDEINWAYFKKAQCYLALKNRTEALKFFAKYQPVKKELVNIEKHFFHNNTLNFYSESSNEFENVNFMIIKARLTNDLKLAHLAKSESFRINYGEAQYFSCAILAKYFNDESEINNLKNYIGNYPDVIYYRII